MRRIVLSKAAIRDRDAIDDYTIEKFGLTQAIRLREAFKNGPRQPTSHA